LVHLVGFIIETYYYTLPYERQIRQKSFSILHDSLWRFSTVCPS